MAGIGIFLLPFGQGNSTLGTYGPQSGLLAVKSIDSIELSTGSRESLGAGLALRSGRTQAFHLYRYFTDQAFGSDHQRQLGHALFMSGKGRGKPRQHHYEIASPTPDRHVRAPN
jgi:hypothetical protein